MERITTAQLNSALTTTEGRLQRRLSNEDGLTLTAILEAAQRRWPNQDTAESMEEYLADFERLTLRYSLPRVEAALAELRIDPNQVFFPRPDEVASEIEWMRSQDAAKLKFTRTQKYLDYMREEAVKHYEFKKAWLASGLTLADFCKKEPA